MSNDIDNIQKNSKRRLWYVRYETVNRIKSKCVKHTQKEYKSRPDWVGKVIHMELSRRLKFDHANKRFMHKPGFIQTNEMQRIL